MIVLEALRVETDVALLADVPGPALAQPEIVVVLVVLVIVVVVVVLPAHRVIVNVLDEVVHPVPPHVVSTGPPEHQRPARLDAVLPVNLQ